MVVLTAVKEDASAALDIMYNAELFGRVFTDNYALHKKIKGAEQGRAAQPIWEDASTWFERRQQQQKCYVYGQKIFGPEKKIEVLRKIIFTIPGGALGITSGSKRKSILSWTTVGCL
ncbi:hypothetical protein MKW98_031375 [Papaver atlanticum]|uniref:Uncharacterized protein n=1 Tax=Papaver atlanticum TaxID=357466 RepID=A0AAD4X9J0_9MAGN|nr:hypothetical protein MKW98_031375 [Papaver atlanticum]